MSNECCSWAGHRSEFIVTISFNLTIAFGGMVAKIIFIYVQGKSLQLRGNKETETYLKWQSWGTQKSKFECRFPWTQPVTYWLFQELSVGSIEAQIILIWLRLNTWSIFLQDLWVKDPSCLAQPKATAEAQVPQSQTCWAEMHWLWMSLLQ